MRFFLTGNHLDLPRVPSQWVSVFAEVCDVLLEPYPPGLQLGLLTLDQFLSLASEVHIDFCATTGISKKIYNQVLLFSVGTYDYDATLAQVESVSAQQGYLEETGDYDLSNWHPMWESAIGTPHAYREDDLTPRQIQVVPAPSTNGNLIQYFPEPSIGGLIGAVSNEVDFTIDVADGLPGFGTIAIAGGAVFMETIGPTFGIPGSMVANANNLQMIGPAMPVVTSLSLNQYIEIVPDAFIPYLKYGILAKVFGSDSELKDEAKANYCSARYQEGVNLLATVLGEFTDSIGE